MKTQSSSLNPDWTIVDISVC